MRTKQFLQPCVMLYLAGAMTAAMSQGPSVRCFSLPFAERESARAAGTCSDRAPIIDVAPIVDAAPEAAQTVKPVVVLVPNVIGLSFDEARDRLAGFTVRRSYVPSAEPGGKVLEQNPAPPARVEADSTIRLVLSDGRLRPVPRVSAAEIDGVRKRPEATVQSPAMPPPVLQQPAPSAPPLPANAAVAQSNAEARKPSAPQAAVSQRSSVAPSKAQPSRVQGEPAASSAVAPARSAQVIETVEVPNVVGRSSTDATAALAKFKIERVEIVANAAPSGQVVAQDPKPGTPLAPGSVISLQLSDGSLTSASGTAPASAQKSAALNRAPVTFPSTAVLLLSAGVLAGLGFGAWWMRRWLAERRDAATVAEAIVPMESAAEIEPTESLAEGEAIEPAAEIDPTKSLVEVDALNHRPKSTRLNHRPKSTRLNHRPKSTRLNHRPKSTRLKSAAEVDAIESPSEVDAIESAAEVEAIESAAEVEAIESAAEVEAIESPVEIDPMESPAEIDRDLVAAEPVSETAPFAVASAAPVVTDAVAPVVFPRITFAAYLGEGETTIEFAAPSDAEEMALEYSKDLHE